MTRFLPLLALVGLAACQNIPPQITVAGCEVAPILIPEHAATIQQACLAQMLAGATTQP